jgi:hypothetical protein
MRFNHLLTPIVPIALSLSVVGPSPIHALQDFEWTGRIEQGGTLEIKGIIGDIRAVPTSSSQIAVSAVMREGRRGYADEIEFDVVEHRDGVTICALYPSRRRSRPNECVPGDRGHNRVDDNDTRVDFTVHVPAGVLFAGRTIMGDIDARGLDQDIEAHTVTGSIDVETRGFATANTVTGSIRASLGRADWRGALEFKTVTGRITVELPEDTGAEVSARTVTGSISTDFPLMVRGRFMTRSVNGTIGHGGRELTLETVTGSIHLRSRG